jgi:bacteriorhodopsin
VDDLDLNQWLWMVAGGFLALAAVSAFMGHRRNRRRDIDRVGIIPWTTIEILSFFAAFGAAVLAARL